MSLLHSVARFGCGVRLAKGVVRLVGHLRRGGEDDGDIGEGRSLFAAFRPRRGGTVSRRPHPELTVGGVVYHGQDVADIWTDVPKEIVLREYINI